MIMSQFILEIELGNDAMQNIHDVCGALLNTATRIELSDLEIDDLKSGKYSIRDINGNTVGHYEVVP